MDLAEIGAPDRGDRAPHRSAPSIADAIRAVIAPFLISRVSVLAIGLLAATIVGYDPPPNDSSLWRISPSPLGNLLARWDSRWYLDIATRGYHWNGNPLEQQNVVFFPLYPMLIRLAGPLTGGHLLLAGLVVSLLAFFAALVYLWRFVGSRRGATAAALTIALVCAFPFSVYYSVVYTEALFLLVMVAAFFHIERRQYTAAAAWGFLAGLARPNGSLLALPLGWIVLTDGPEGRRRSVGVVAAAAPLAGMALYSLYLRLAVGDAFAWVRGQAAWPTIAPWGRHVAEIAATPNPAFSSTPIADVFIHVGNAAAIGFAALGVVPVVRLIGIPYALLIALNVVPPIANHGLLSLGRFTSVMFPLFIWLAIVLPPRRRALALIAFAVLQTIAAALFFTWRPLV